MKGQNAGGFSIPADTDWSGTPEWTLENVPNGSYYIQVQGSDGQATRAFAGFLETTENPRSDAEIVFSPMEGNCARFSNKEVLLKIQKRLSQLAALSSQK